MAGDPLDMVRDALLAAGCDPKGSQKITAKCPAHDDSSPSLSVARGTQQPVVLRCHAGCSPDAVLDALRLTWADLCEDDDDWEPPVQPKRISAVYSYVDEQGMALYEVVRYDPKDFRQRQPGGTWGIGNIRRVLFRLPAVMEAVTNHQVVYICEGEKDVLAVEATGAVATCNPGGAGKWKADYDQFFAGAQVVIISDDDEPGYRHTRDVIRHLEVVAASVKAVLPVDGAKDIAQHLGMGRTLDDVRPFDEPEPVKVRADEWEAPVPLGQTGKPPVFPAHRLPPWLNAYVVALAEAVQVPVDLPAMLALTALSAAAGGRAFVQVKPGYDEKLNLYTATAMAPGSRKTPVFMRVTAPLMAYEHDAIVEATAEVHEAKIRLAIAKADAVKAQIEAEKAGTDARAGAAHYAAVKAMEAESITVPTMPRLLVDDATPEALTSLMAEQGGRIAMFSDEGDVFSMMAGRYSKGANLGVYLKAHGARQSGVDRKGRDPEIIKKPALTLGLTVQPVVLSQLFTIEGARGRGLLGRFLWSVPPSNVGYRRSDPEPVPAEVEALFTTNLRALVATLAEWTDPLPLVFTPAAKAALTRYQDSIEPRLRDPGGDLAHIGDWAGKIVGHVARIAGLLHLATHMQGNIRGSVDATMVDDAVKIGDYLCIHALHAFQTMNDGPVHENARAVIKWARDNDVSVFSRRQVQQACRHRMPTVEDLKPVLELLEGSGHLRRVPPPEPGTKGGRPRGPIYEVNPLVRT